MASTSSDMRAFNEQLIAEFRANHGQLSGRMAGSRLMLLTTKGSKTGHHRTTVIGYRPWGERFVAIASNNGAPSHPAWYRNLLADPVATAEVGPDRFEVRTRTARPEERDELARLIEYLAPQQALTSREIPIVVMDRV